MTLRVAPVSHKPFAPIIFGIGFGGAAGSKASLMLRSVMIRLSFPLAFRVKACNCGGGGDGTIVSVAAHEFELIMTV